MLKFQIGNAKLNDRTIHFSLPAGHSCCGAYEFLSYSDRITGKITDGSDTQFRCWAASGEARSPQLRKMRWSNYLQLKAASSVKQMYKLLYEALYPLIDNYAANHGQLPYVRHGVSGDFFNIKYFDAWLRLAEKFAPTNFYAYTKSIPMWEKFFGEIPKNFVLNGSLGGKWDHLIHEHDLKYAKVVYSVEEANELNLPLDHDDSLARVHGPSFGLLLHGTQPANSKASVALQNLKKQREWSGYGKTHKTAIENIEAACA